jgi:hypothetical protein
MAPRPSDPDLAADPPHRVRYFYDVASAVRRPTSRGSSQEAGAIDKKRRQESVHTGCGWMGKYIRKSSSRGGGTGTAPAVVVAGVRTRSRAAAAAAPAPKRPRKARAEVEVDEGRDGAEEGCCYLQLRSRRLFMVVVAADVAAASPETVPVAAAEVGGGEASPAVPLAVTGSTASVEAVVVAAGASRCSSTASSVDAAALRERSGCTPEVWARSLVTSNCPMVSLGSGAELCLFPGLVFLVSTGARRLRRGKLRKRLRVRTTLVS